MAMVSISHPRSEILSSIEAFVAARIDAWKKRREYRATVKELSVLSSRELSDLGLHRSEIHSVAMNAVYDA